MTDTITFGTTQTVADIVRKLIDPRVGMDFKIVPIPMTPTPGFEIHIFALSGEEHSYGWFTLPRNPAKFSIRPGELKHMVQSHIVTTLANQYDRINVVGSRMVVCCTLRASHAYRDLVPKWSDALEAAYKAGTGRGDDDEPELHDEARENDRFAPVYAYFGAPAQWDMNEGRATGPQVNDDGSLTWQPEDAIDYQNKVRRTMTVLPYVRDPGYTHYVAAEFLGIGVSVLNDDWGVALDANPRYLLALNHFDLETDRGELRDDEKQYDYETLVATIAIESDHRLRLHHELVSGTSPVGEEITIEVPDAELWVMAVGTVVGINPATGDIVSTHLPRVLRNDIARLGQVMAGAIARYKMQRARAELRYKGFWPIAGLLGQILDVIEEQDDTEYLDAPVSSIEWIGGAEPMTILRAGMAR